MIYKKLLALSVLVLLMGDVAYAQEQAQDQKIDIRSDIYNRLLVHDANVRLLEDNSLFFIPRELALLDDARRGVVARPATDQEVNSSQDLYVENVPQGPRELAMGGILYQSKDKWTIWLNGMKVTPKRLPSEVLDIRVEKDVVRLKWFDAYTNRIYPIKLRAHQRFNIDTRIFLPG